jgi:hypothetical protein
MSTLHTATIGTWLQLLPQVVGLIDKAEAHCAEQGLAPQAITEARLAPDMWNWAAQVRYTARHSAGTIEALRTGVARPNFDPAPTEFAPLRELVSDALSTIRLVTPAEIDGAADRDVRFEYPGGGIDFRGEDFLVSFALPNFYFHLTTAYAILRSQGVKVGKMDYLGQIRAKR